MNVVQADLFVVSYITIASAVAAFPEDIVPVVARIAAESVVVVMDTGVAALPLDRSLVAAGVRNPAGKLVVAADRVGKSAVAVGCSERPCRKCPCPKWLP